MGVAGVNDRIVDFRNGSGQKGVWSDQEGTFEMELLP